MSGKAFWLLIGAHLLLATNKKTSKRTNVETLDVFFQNYNTALFKFHFFEIY